MKNSTIKDEVEKKLINIAKPMGRIMIKRKISIAPWTNEE